MKLGCSYFGNRILRHVRSDMKYLADHHFTYVVHTFSENDFHFYKDTMKDIISITHDYGMEAVIDPWGVGKVFGGESFTNFITVNHEAAQVLSDGKPGPAACPNNPDFRKFMLEWIDAAVDTKADYVLWDEPHFYIKGWMGGRPGTWGCKCRYCREKFEAKYNKPMPDEEDNEVREFKGESIRDFLQTMINLTYERKVRNTLCILPNAKTSDKTIKALASMEHLDNFGTDPYWIALKKDVKSCVGDFSRKIVDVCRETKRESHIWIQGFKIPAGREEEIYASVNEAVNAGIRNLAVWGFDACAHISCIAPENPKKTWDVILDAFSRVKDIK